MSDETERPCEHCKGEKYRLTLHKGTGDLHRVPCACVHTLPVPFVYQTEDMGCGVAVVGMVVGKSYFEVKQHINVLHDFGCEGIDCHVLESLLWQFGFATQIRHETNALTRAARKEWPCEPWADLAICQVRNTRDAGWHFVVLLRDGRVLDPYWGVMQGLHRYPRVAQIIAAFPVAVPAA